MFYLVFTIFYKFLQNYFLNNMYKYLKMSDMFEGLEQIEKVKKPRKKREMTAERKAQLKEQLKKGRKTAKP